MRKNSYIRGLTESQTLGYVRSISEGKNEEQFVERLGDRKPVRIWVETLQQIDFIINNSFNELVVTPDGRNYLEYDLHR